jgi:D-arabinose 1-dehydrogenase-like Zn-dependent alcohol dehydrogenase
MDGILDTVSAMHPILPLIDLLKTHGKLVLLGAPEKPLELPVFPLLVGKFYKIEKLLGGCIVFHSFIVIELIRFVKQVGRWLPEVPLEE